MKKCGPERRPPKRRGRRGGTEDAGLEAAVTVAGDGLERRPRTLATSPGGYDWDGAAVFYLERACREAQAAGGARFTSGL